MTAPYHEERIVRVEDHLQLPPFEPPPPPAPTSIPAPVIVVTVNADRSSLITWESVDTATEYEVHEFLKTPDATLKATVTTTSRSSTPLAGGNYQYAVKAKNAQFTSDFSNKVLIFVDTVAATNPPPATPIPTSTMPSDVLPSMKNWTLMLPTGAQGDPDNVYPTGLKIDNVFWVKNGGVAFRARCDGFHSENSLYPRSELREMKDTNWTKGAWSNTSGTHTLLLNQAITATPVAKPHVVSAQIHSGSDDVIQIRLEGSRLMVMYNDGASTVTLDSAYVKGTRFDVKIVAAAGRVKVSYNNVQKADLALSGTSWYFKAGCYTQSNVSKGDKPDAYGEVIIYTMTLTHT